MSYTTKEIGTKRLFGIIPQFQEYVNSEQNDSSVLNHDDVTFWIECLLYSFFPNIEITDWMCLVIHEKDIGCHSLNIKFELSDYNETEILTIFETDDFTKDWMEDEHGRRDVWTFQNYKGKKKDDKNVHHWLLDRLIQKYRSLEQ